MAYNIRKTCLTEIGDGLGWHYFYAEQTEIDDTIVCPDHPEAETFDFVIMDEGKQRKEVIADIFSEIVDQDQFIRLTSALDHYSSFILALDERNYDLARMKIQQAYAEGYITEDDFNFVISKIPA